MSDATSDGGAREASTIDLDLKAGATDFTTTKVTRQLEPDSVVLRGRNGGKAVNVL